MTERDFSASPCQEDFLTGKVAWKNEKVPTKKEGVRSRKYRIKKVLSIEQLFPTLYSERFCLDFFSI